MSSAPSELTSKDEELRKILLATITVYKDRTWIDETEEHGFRSLLLINKKDNFVPTVKSLDAMKKRLLTIKKEKLKEQSKARKEAKRKKADKNHKIYYAQDLVDVVSDEETERLFTEMCVFARMSFIQPACCLHCAFKQSLLKDKADVEEEITRGKCCENLVVWRKDANISLHPDNLDRNLLIVSCATARAWMRGKPVQAFMRGKTVHMKWDKNAKKVLNVEQ